jgi:hypothetical protein
MTAAARSRRARALPRMLASSYQAVVEMDRPDSRSTITEIPI